jgi:transglutaminase superfamily protein
VKRHSLGAKMHLVGEIILTYVRVRWGMGRLELGEQVARLRNGRLACRAPVPPAERRRLGAIVMRVLALIPADSRCLARSLVLLGLLARRGVASTLVIGVRTEPAFAAHAWIECDGEALLPSGNGEFTPLTTV